MTFNKAIEAIVALNGGVERFTAGEINRMTKYSFPSLAAADHCKDILDALAPVRFTGAVYGPGWLLVATIVPEEVSA